MTRPALEVTDLFRRFGERYRHEFAAGFDRQQRRVMRAIESCRTAELGGHREQCDHCGHERICYNSCRNRHCPKCQSVAKSEWLQARQEELLPVDYFHVVFTLPQSLAPLALQNKRVMYNLLFHTVSQTLLTVAGDPRQLGAQIGFLAILHTWGQNLLHHPHLHCLVPSGGLSSDRVQWISCQSGFFLPVKVLSRLFRRLFLEALQRAYEKETLEFHGRLEGLSQPRRFQKLLATLRRSDWVVYAQPPFAGPQRVLDYLSRYTHRIAFSNHRLLSLRGDQVTFRWKDYRKGSLPAQMTLSASEFIRRFLLHVLPDHFVRIRYYGLLANRRRQENLCLCRQLLELDHRGVSKALPKPLWNRFVESLTGIDPLRCPHCQQGQMIRTEVIRPSPSRPLRAPPEKSNA